MINAFNKMYDLCRNYFIVVNRKVYLFVNKEITRNLYSWNSFKARNLGKGLFNGRDAITTRCY
jgi:hypothetical protein